MPAIERFTPVSVKWVDVQVFDGPHIADDFVFNFIPCVRETAGYYITTFAGHLFIAETLEVAETMESDCERINQIPLAYIKELSVLKDDIIVPEAEVRNFLIPPQT